MTPTFDDVDFTQFSVEQRLTLIGRIWDSIDPDQTALPVPEWHRELLRERLAATADDSEVLTPWSELKRELLGE